ncbi:hypothetical protein PanWU01x14_367330 [Parasponia andersonii]|uniref:Uncharacterized protein n=1 Tax=Parasponia andersonii TaxID=3476 RepID=A0A2P5A5B4_PARAD|nr:hypothetical protein PanWU01x14_367330 [Parasponia andersonii]
MAIFNTGKMGLRYIYLDDPCDETNPTGPVGGRMVTRIVAGGQKSEMATLSSPAAPGGRQRARHGAGEVRQ